MKKRSLVIGILVTACTISLASTLWIAYSYFTLQKQLYGKTSGLIEQELQAIAKKLNKSLCAVTKAATKITDELNKGSLQLNAVAERLQKTASEQKNIASIGIALTTSLPTMPTMQDMLVVKQDGKPQTKQIKPAPEKAAKKWAQTLEKGQQWQKPFLDTQTNTWSAQFSVPFYQPSDLGKKKPIGVLYITYPLAVLEKLLQQEKPDQTMYTSVITKDGTFIYQQERFGIDTSDYVGWCGQAEDTLPATPYTTNIAGQPAWILCLPLKCTDWYLTSITFITELFAQKTSLLQRYLMQVIML